jgi:anaerobic magnesium-protoporphyrin IX monomethyl ester cyclase
MRAPSVYLINPTITSRRHARFPLSLLSLAGQLQDRYDCAIIDGNIERDTVATTRRLFANAAPLAVGISVMGGPQVAPAIDLSRAIRAMSPSTPIVWGGYFPTLYPDAALSAGYVDYLIRGQGEATMRELLASLQRGAGADLGSITGLSWRLAGRVKHNAQRPFSPASAMAPLPYELLGDPRRYSAKTFLGQHTVAYQSALGCRFRCTFCGVAAMFRGATALPSAAILERDLRYLKHEIGADSIQYFDHNFFDREADMIPLLEVQARMAMPWWCYARADAMVNLSPQSWELVRKSQLRMAYIGAESPNEQLLHDIRKGTHADQTLEAARLCHRHGVVPELSFMVAPPVDPEGETERTFEFIRRIKQATPAAEIIVYVYTPIPTGGAMNGALASRTATVLRDTRGDPVVFPRTPEEWTEPQWVAYACHADAPWLTDRLRKRIRDFVTVLRCRFPTAQDTRSPAWAKAALSRIAAVRYRYRKYGNPWELDLCQRIMRLADPRATGI